MTKAATLSSRMPIRGAFFIVLALVGVVLLYTLTKRESVSAPVSAPVSPEVLALLERGKASVREDVDRMQHASALLTALNTHTKTNPHPHSQRRGVLCVTFQSWSEANSAHLARNVLSLGEACHWLVLVYNSRGKDDAEMMRDLRRDLQQEASKQSNTSTKNNNNNSVYLFSHTDANESSSPSSSSSSSSSAGKKSAHGRQRITIMQPPRREDSVREFRRLCESYLSSRSLPRALANTSCAFIHEPPMLDSSAAINRKLYPKVMMLLSVLSHASLYEHVWLLDGDLSFEGFDFAEYLRIHHCAFDTPPLVAQPAIVEGRGYQFLGSSFWRDSPYIASKLGFVEVMAPFMEAQFFEWFVLAFVVPMFGPVHVMAADWGFDELFCKAALWFHRTRTGKGNNNNSKLSAKSLSLSNDAENQCAVIISTPIHHEDSQEIGKALGGGKEALNGVLRDAIAKHYRPLYWTGGEEDKRIKKIYGTLLKLKGKFHGNTKGRVVATKQDCSVDTKLDA